MFVADLDRPWVDTPFPLQGFLIEDERQIAELRSHCAFVVIDRARSTGDEFEPPEATTNTIPPTREMRERVLKAIRESEAAANKPKHAPAPSQAQSPTAGARVISLEEVLARRGAPSQRPALAPRGNGADESYPGLLGRVLDTFRGLWKRDPSAKEPHAALQAAEESPQEFAARAALMPPGVQVQTYRDQVPVEVEVVKAREVAARTSSVLEKLVADVRAGHLLEIDDVEEVVHEMVESIVRNPDALMWVTRLREEDITTYGHSLQVAVYLTAFGRQLGFPKPQLAHLGQVGLLLDIGKIRLPKALLEKNGRLTEQEFEAAKLHVQHGLDILSATPNFHKEMLEGIAQHHERMNGSGYPAGLAGSDISLYGRMAGIADCFAAITKRRPYAEAVSSYEAMRSLSGWSGDFFQEALVQQFISSVGVFPVGSLIELSTGEVAIVVAHNKVRRLKPRVLVVTGPDKKAAQYPSLIDLLYDPKTVEENSIYIRRGLASGAYGLDLKDFYLA